MDPAFKQKLQVSADSQGTSSRSLAISVERYDEICKHLLHPESKVDPHFKAWVKQRQFQLTDLPGLGLKQVLAIPNTKTDKVSPLLLIKMLVAYVKCKYRKYAMNGTSVDQVVGKSSVIKQHAVILDL